MIDVKVTKVLFIKSEIVEVHANKQMMRKTQTALNAEEFTVLLVCFPAIENLIRRYSFTAHSLVQSGCD